MCTKPPSATSEGRPISLPARLGLALIWIYRHSLSLVMGRACRYAPTCSHYTEEAILRYGLWAGGWMGLARILRCNPFGASGYDPIPEALPPQARWYAPWRYGRWTGRHIRPEHRLD
ncbi:membrane protein insertion efficiency factor YidD [Polymorphum gilvum]|uniref:Putative membrane protein insertion efficiency factor n=1 Tax=Polymorphum gilvum (strain LMG 25793 / CGMCC 1.9160 / SL003B-26A1) TaxID=991905 RepID=F2J528_POLGS|nr:membrane protein insertion efficiency factor YidD [Polymorphum gilvum]ADZ70070.1 hypothetical protein SL003B_1642 [Polymorphum gilvum SL003B-26A1]